MADEKSPTYKDARTMKELLAQLRSDADLIAIDIQNQQLQFCCVLLVNVAVLATATLKSLGGYFAITSAAFGGIIPALLLFLVGVQKFFWFNKITYATIHRDFMPASIEESLERLLGIQLKRIEFLIHHRNFIQIATLLLTFYLVAMAFLLAYMGAVAADLATMPRF